MNLRILSDDQLRASALSVAKREREETLNLLKHLSEIERGHLYSKFKCDSLHAYCVTYLKMSDPQAGRRVSASRLLTELPVLEEKVLSGTMTPTSVAQANTFFRKEAISGNKFDRETKLKVLREIEGQATRKVEQILLSKTESLTEIKLLVNEKTLSSLNRLKEILSHSMPGASYAQVIAKLAELGLEKLDPDLKSERALKRSQLQTQKVTPAPDVADLGFCRSRKLVKDGRTGRV